jgi:hypothetical protein
MRISDSLIVAALGLLVAAPAAAQGVVPQAGGGNGDVQIKSTTVTPTERGETRVVPPPMLDETTRPRDVDFYSTPNAVKVETDPAFIEPVAVHYETPSGSGRFGLSGWTAPNTPVGSPVSGWRDVSGWFVLGFSLTWDGPPAPPKPRPR